MVMSNMVNLAIAITILFSGAVGFVGTAHGYSLSQSLCGGVGRSQKRQTIRMDTGEPFMPFAFRPDRLLRLGNNNNNNNNSNNFKKGKTQSDNSGIFTNNGVSPSLPISLKYPHQHGGKNDNNNHDCADVDASSITFLPFWDSQISTMQHSLSNLQELPVTSRDNAIDFGFCVASDSPSSNTRIVNQCFRSDEFRKIRMTYYHDSAACQVYTSLWYPQHGTDLPILGIDLLQFGGSSPDSRKKYVIAIDFQPVVSRKITEYNDGEDEDDADGSAVPRCGGADTSPLASIRDRFPSLQGQMSDRWYDKELYFSDHILFGRFDNGEDDKDLPLEQDVLPAFQQAVEAYLELIQSKSKNETTDSSSSNNSQPDTAKLREQRQKLTMERQKAFDRYFAEHDRAKHMIKKKFGEEWTDAYVHDFLFGLSR